MSEHRTNACPYEEMDEELEIMVNGYSLPEVLERLAVVARKINAAPDAPAMTTVFSVSEGTTTMLQSKPRSAGHDDIDDADYDDFITGLIEEAHLTDAEQAAAYEAAQAAALARVAASDRRAFERATPAQQAALFIICRTHGTDDLEAMCRYVVDTVAQEGTCAEHEARMCE